MANSISNSCITKMSSTRCLLTSLTLTAIFIASFTPITSSQPLGASVASPDSPPSPDCFTPLLNMSDCLTFVEQGSNLTQPEKPCCAELAGLVDTNPACLCRLLGNGGSFGVLIDLSRAKKLPDVCHVSTPPVNVSFCSAVGGYDSATPNASPFGSSDTAESLTPSTLNKENGAYSFKHTTLLFGISSASVLVHLVL